MRPKLFTYTLAAAHADGWLDGSTGVGPWATFVGQPGDGCSHPVTILSSADLSLITFALTGTDSENRVLTENVTGPNATTVTSTKYFKTLTSVAASATIGANTIDVGWTALAHTPTYPVAVYPHDGTLVGVNLNGTTCTYTIQQTNDAIFDNNPAQWHTMDTPNIDVDSMHQAEIAVTAIRLDVASHSSGVISMTVSQARA